MSDKKRTSFVFMLDWIPIFSLLDDKSQVDELLRAISSLMNDDEPVITDPKVEAAWNFIGPKIKANIDHYDEVCRNRSEAGKKGGLASAKQKQANAKQTASNREANMKQIQHDTDTDTDTDTVTVTGELISLRDLNSQGKEKVKKENPRTGFDKILDSDPTISNYPELRETYIGFIQMRKAIKKPLTDRGLQLIIGKVEKLAASPDDQIAILNQSIENSWQGVFELKQDKQLTTRSASMSAFDQFRQQEGLGPATSIFGG